MISALSIAVEVPQRRTLAAVRRARVWTRAILAMGAEVRRRTSSRAFIRPSVPGNVTDAWIVQRDGIPFLCVYQYTIVPPLNGGPLVGRVDVMWKS